MYKAAAVLTFLLALSPSWSPQGDYLSQCYERCQAPPTDSETERQEIVNLEKEAAHAIQLSDGTFFRRVYSDDFAGTLSHGEAVNKAGFINAVQSAAVKYEAFFATDIKIHIFRETAVATCLWSSRAIVRGQSVNYQMRVMHIYVNSGSGWKVVASQASPLPPYTQQAL
ncbi:MAG TPA: nuclear transport factor 2 family protein [Candidatus Acidoferrum sp.]|nr:nuclear transport factor 2 family protein [Candidatus Acidoferrum sp.]